jgi:hypothetical protein
MYSPPPKSRKLSRMPRRDPNLDADLQQYPHITWGIAKRVYSLRVMTESHGSVFAQFAKLSNSKEETAATDESSKQLPKGVVLGKDGKPYERWIQHFCSY